MPDLLEQAAAALRRGELVAFPTETVYGLGANALDADAVARIYQRKNRPCTSPLIVHVDSIEMARSLVTEWPDAAVALTGLYWPGPLTLVLPKRATVPDIVTAGLPTVGIRMPAHPLALALIRQAGIPIAAPSANRFTQLSPTTATHVRRSLGDDLLVLDGGPSEVGIESTVLSLAGPARLLRPGAISLQQLTDAIGTVANSTSPADKTAAHESPGQHEKHYQPLTPLLFAGNTFPNGNGAYLFLRNHRETAKTIAMPNIPAAYAALLYGLLHDLDALHLHWIAVEKPPETPEWAGVLDRLSRAVH